MNLCRTGEWALSDVIDADLSPEELRRLAKVDALLRAVAACDLHGVAPYCVDPRSVRSDAKW
jgi:hypothetical protein